jgi:hypothetical protein
MLIAAVAGLAVFTLQLRAQLRVSNHARDLAQSENEDLTLQLKQCREAMTLGKDLYGELSGAYSELILLYSIEHHNAVGNAQEQYGKWSGAAERVSLSQKKSETFFDLSDVCLANR